MIQTPQIIIDLLDLLYPNCCLICDRRLTSQEHYICMRCWADLPVSQFHKNEENKTAQIFWGRIPIEQAASWFFYRKGSRYQKIIHAIKYFGMRELGKEAGKRYGNILSGSPLFKNVDLIVPVPLHPKKERQRGYNQSAWIAQGVAEALGLPTDLTNLTRKIYTNTQTKKGRYERWLNVEGLFSVTHPEIFQNRHILLVDDVLTTGATIEACATELLKVRGVRVSVITLAFADI